MYADETNDRVEEKRERRRFPSLPGSLKVAKRRDILSLFLQNWLSARRRIIDANREQLHVAAKVKDEQGSHKTSVL